MSQKCLRCPLRRLWTDLRRIWGGGSSKMNRTYSPYDVKYDVNGGELRNEYVVYFSVLTQCQCYVMRTLCTLALWRTFTMTTGRDDRLGVSSDYQSPGHHRKNLGLPFMESRRSCDSFCRTARTSRHLTTILNALWRTLAYACWRTMGFFVLVRTVRACCTRYGLLLGAIFSRKIVEITIWKVFPKPIAKFEKLITFAPDQLIMIWHARDFWPRWHRRPTFPLCVPCLPHWVYLLMVVNINDVHLT
jgi:hypothetical protein